MFLWIPELGERVNPVYEFIPDARDFRHIASQITTHMAGISRRMSRLTLHRETPRKVPDKVLYEANKEHVWQT
jgi:hypothetical protein